MARSSTSGRLQPAWYLRTAGDQPDVTSDFISPVSTLDLYPGDPLLRGAIRVWDFKKRKILRTVEVPGAPGTMDVKLIPGDPKARAFTAGMFDGLVYLVDTRNGTAQVVFDCEN